MTKLELFSLGDIEEAHEAARRLYETVRQRLTVALPTTADIRHIGATAIPHCLTKGDLDIVVRVPAQHFVAADHALVAQFARNEGSVRTVDFSAFEDPMSFPHLGSQLVVVASALDTFHIFVEALKQSPATLADYNSLKRNHDGGCMETYRQAKAAFVGRVVAQFVSTGAATNFC